MADLNSPRHSNGRKRLFISYKRSVDPDERIALQVYEALSQQHEVFIDRTMLVGTRWAERIETELRRSDYLITLLSHGSVNSQMVQGEIESAHRLHQEQGGTPKILPVRVAYSRPFSYPLSAYLNHIQWISWETMDDTDRLIKELLLAIAGEALTNGNGPAEVNAIHVGEPSTPPEPLPQAQPLSLEMPEGTMDRESYFYVSRKSEAHAFEAIKRRGETITIKGPRQIGKSSLLVRILGEAAAANKAVVFLDFQRIDKSTLKNAGEFFRQFCSWVTAELDMEDRVDELWGPHGNGTNCTNYFRDYLLKELHVPLVLGMDEVDSIFDTDFRSDFFGMLRSWHNGRATGSLVKGNACWKQLDLVLVTSTEPYQLIENLNQSPFNVGHTIELEDFDSDQVADLNNRHGTPLSPGELERLIKLLNGHPYLVRRALYLVASRQMSAGDLFARATDERGPFGDHLRHLCYRMYGNKELIQGMLKVIRRNTCQDERLFFRLHGAGLVRRNFENGKVVPRCQLYADYFKEHLYV